MTPRIGIPPRRRDGASRRVAAPRGRRAERGFALFEVLGAMTIAALLAVVLIQASSLAARATASAEDLVATVLVAQEVMDRLRLEPVAGRPVRSGREGAFRWRAEFTSDAPMPAEASAAPPGGAPGPLVLFRIVLDVEAPSGRHVELRSLVAQGQP